MSDCCYQSKQVKKTPRKQACPVNHNDYVRVPLKTILHHTKAAWDLNLKEQAYYFCDDPGCDVVYFAEDGSVINKSELRTAISKKEKSSDVLVCHCFGVRMQDAIEKPEIKGFVKQQTKLGNCSCETSNPSGRCCLKCFP